MKSNIFCAFALAVLLLLSCSCHSSPLQSSTSQQPSPPQHNYQNGVCTDCLDIQEGSAEQNDFAVNGCITSLAPTRYGTTSVLERQTAIVSENSALAIRGSFNNENAEVYQGYQVWTLVQIDLTKAFNGTVDLREKALQFDVKKRNCGDYSSVYISTAMGIETNEEAFSTASNQTTLLYSVQAIEMAWTRVTLNFSTMYDGNNTFTNRKVLPLSLITSIVIPPLLPYFIWIISSSLMRKIAAPCPIAITPRDIIPKPNLCLYA